MEQSPIRLENYVLKSVQLDTIDTAKPANLGEHVDWEGATLSSDVEVGVDPNLSEASRFLVQLTVRGEPKAEDSFPYRFKIVMAGVFSAPGAQQDERARLVAVNGTSILYSAAREILLTLTMRAPMGAVLLPTVQFLSMAKIFDEAPSSSEASPGAESQQAKDAPSVPEGFESVIVRKGV